MISLEDFYRAIETFRPTPDKEQRAAIDAPANKPLFIVAGPGTGKTTCLTLRILKLILVDEILPDGILATTFTKKAAAELRSRILGWGFRLIETLQQDKRISSDIRQQIGRVDINQVVTGTIDSLCEQILRHFREPGMQPPTLVDEFVSSTLLLRDGLLETGLYQNPDLDAELLRINGSSYGWHIGKKNDLLMNFWERRWQDQVNWQDFLKNCRKNGKKGFADALDQALGAYQTSLETRSVLDFALLEQEVLKRLRAGQLQEFTQNLQVLLVDEYQDTNLLQESIYMEMARACKGNICVVGDDDQSLYRFRGATVELFSNFSARYEHIFGKPVKPIFIRNNYRSTRRIIDLVNNYSGLDPSYQTVRVERKPQLSYPANQDLGVPILGMFRDDTETLADDLTKFIARVFRGSGYRLQDGTLIKKNSESGDLGDCAFLCSSPAEHKADGTARLPFLLRDKLGQRNIEVFNPRGQDLENIPIVARFGGFLLECLDPGGVIAGQVSGLSQDIQDVFDAWRAEAISYADSDDAPDGLVKYAIGWAERNPRRKGMVWPPSVPTLDLIYGLLHFFPDLHDDPEGQVYLEIFTRQIAACEKVGKFKGRVVTQPSKPGLTDASIKELIRNFLAPIASGTIKVNEELIEAFPRDRLSFLSIHQSKGLEFPLIIIDVGADFRTNHASHAFKRFPKKGGVPHELEDMLRPSTYLGIPNRSQCDRVFDDLYRQYFVGYSRPQDVLLMVGLNATRPGGKVQNIATGSRRDGSNAWLPIPPYQDI